MADTAYTYCPNCGQDLDIPNGATQVRCVHGCRNLFAVEWRGDVLRPTLAPAEVDPIEQLAAAIEGGEPFDLQIVTEKGTFLFHGCEVVGTPQRTFDPDGETIAVEETDIVFEKREVKE